MLRRTLLATLILAAPMPAQTLLGIDGVGAQFVWELSPAAGGACLAPDALAAACNYVSPVCGVPPLGPVQLGSLLGDIADDPITDTAWVTDGFVVEQLSLDTPCAGPLGCTPLNAFLAPTFMGPLTGLGFDNSGGVVAPAGTPLLWMTDGLRMAAVSVPGPGTCAPPTLVFGPCTLSLPGGAVATDLSWAPQTGELWVCDSLGRVHKVQVFGGACTLVASWAPTACALTPRLVGIAVDTARPGGAGVPPSLPALYVTDGFVVAYLDETGLPASSTFYTPQTCTPVIQPIAGLALTQHGNRYGQTTAGARLDAFGQSTTPGPTFGLEVIGAPAGANAWLVSNFNVPGPGFLCPPALVVGALGWVDPSPPALITFLGPLPGPCVPLPLPIPPALPVGVEVYSQVFFLPAGGPPAVDATNAVSITIADP